MHYRIHGEPLVSLVLTSSSLSTPCVSEAEQLRLKALLAPRAARLQAAKACVDDPEALQRLFAQLDQDGAPDDNGNVTHTGVVELTTA